MPRKQSSPVELLMRQTEKTASCWLWQGYTTEAGYGQVKVGGRNGKVMYTHRLSYELFVGPIPNGFMVCHSCDTPNCINPEHFFLGTNADNQADKVSKGRQLAGEAIRSSVLTDDLVRQIREMYDNRIGPTEIGNILGIDPSHACKVGRRRRWKHVA